MLWYSSDHIFNPCILFQLQQPQYQILPSLLAGTTGCTIRLKNGLDCTDGGLMRDPGFGKHSSDFMQLFPVELGVSRAQCLTEGPAQTAMSRHCVF